MKKLLIVVSLLLIVLGLGSSSNQSYKTDMTVIESYDNTVICEDKTGNIWELKTTDKDIQNAIELTVTLDSKGTKTVVDDEIINYLKK